jgi:trimeric autotransporter adhesin
MTPKKQVSPAIRILRGERDASARATHLEAATRKFLVTTNERKQMSTTTNFKRIALVAVAALGMGVLSSVPSQATFVGTSTAPLTLSTTNGTAGLSNVGGTSDSRTAGTFSLTALSAAVTDSVAVTSILKSKPALASSTNPALVFMLNDTGTSTAMPNIAIKDYTASTIRVARVLAGNVAADTATDFSIAPAAGTASGYVVGNWKVWMDSNTASATRVAGTYVYTIIATSSSPAVTQTVDISFTVTASTTVATTPSAVTSFVNLLSAAQASGSNASDAVITSVSTAGTNAGYIYVGNRNAANGTTTAEDSITVAVTGPGLVCSTTLSSSPTAITCGKSLKVSAIGDQQFILQADGTAGASSIVVTASVGAYTSTKSATFYSAAAKTLTATIAHPILKVGTNSGAVRVTGVDALGTNWSGQAYIVASSATDALVGGSSTTPVACGAYSSTLGYAACDISTLTTGTAKFKVIDAATVALATATSNEVTVTVANATPASVKLSFDKATYAPNERARIYVTPLDAAGKEMQSITADLLATGGITLIGSVTYAGSTTTADSLTATSITTSASTSSTSGAKAGSMVYTVYMPAAGGTVTLSATGGTGLPVAARVAVTATATVTDSGAAALAAVNALATTVASLKTLITTLTNLVLKIQKKVKA